MRFGAGGISTGESTLQASGLISAAQTIRTARSFTPT